MKATVTSVHKKAFKNREGETINFLEVDLTTDRGTYKNTAGIKLLEQLNALLDSGEPSEFTVEKSSTGKFKIKTIGVEREESAMEAGNAGTQYAKYEGKGGGYKKDPAESKRIVLQNSMAHATAISLHNAGTKQVDVDTVIAMATKIAGVIMGERVTTKKESAPDLTEEVLMDDEVDF